MANTAASLFEQAMNACAAEVIHVHIIATCQALSLTISNIDHEQECLDFDAKAEDWDSYASHVAKLLKLRRDRDDFMGAIQQLRNRLACVTGSEARADE